jgi:hypothetical protein
MKQIFVHFQNIEKQHVKHYLQNMSDLKKILTFRIY